MRRRHFLAALLASASMPAPVWADAGNPAFLAAAKAPGGSYALYGLSAAGTAVFRIPLPDRGHAAAAHPVRPEAVAFARRPGTYALVVDCLAGQVAQRLEAPAGRHFYGHGAYLDAGRLLATTENEVETGQGRIGLWAREEGYARVGEIASGGIGPHELLALPGDVLAVANGGIRTHPDRGRQKLNLPEMRPNLSYVTLSRGVEEQVALEPELHLNSIRHLAYRDGQVGFAMQWQGDSADPVPLLGLHRRGQGAVLAEPPISELIAMKGYAGSIAMAEGVAGITSPRGGRVQLFDLSGRFLGSQRRADVCGLAAGPAGMVATDGFGAVLALEDGMRPLAVHDCAWDNHLVRLNTG